MKALLYVAIAAALFFVPVQRLDVAKLEPVKAVAVWEEGDSVCLKTDTGDYGSGATAAQALASMKEASASVIYLDTARYLLVAEGSEKLVEQLRPLLKGSVLVGPYFGDSVARETAILEVHGNLVKLRDFRS